MCTDNLPSLLRPQKEHGLLMWPRNLPNVRRPNRRLSDLPSIRRETHHSLLNYSSHSSFHLSLSTNISIYSFFSCTSWQETKPNLPPQDTLPFTCSLNRVFAPRFSLQMYCKEHISSFKFSLILIYTIHVIQLSVCLLYKMIHMHYYANVPR